MFNFQSLSKAMESNMVFNNDRCSIIVLSSSDEGLATKGNENPPNRLQPCKEGSGRWPDPKPLNTHSFFDDSLLFMKYFMLGSLCSLVLDHNWYEKGLACMLRLDYPFRRHSHSIHQVLWGKVSTRKMLQAWDSEDLKSQQILVSHRMI